MCQDQFARMVIKRGTGVPTIPVSADHRNGDWIATDIYEGEFYMDTSTGLVYTRNGSDIKTATGAPTELVFKAKVEQINTDPPTLTIVRNDFGGTITTSYSVPGGYGILGFNSQLTGNVEIAWNYGSLVYDNHVLSLIATSSTIAFSTYIAGVQSNNAFSGGCDKYITVTKYL